MNVTIRKEDANATEYMRFPIASDVFTVDQALPSFVGA